MSKSKPAPRPWEGAFLDALRAGENQVGAARVAGIHRTTASGLARRDPRFAAELAFAQTTPRRKSTAAQPAPRKTAHKLALFLARLAETSNVSAAAAEADLTTATVYARRRSDPAFAQDWSDALAEGYDRLEIDLLERLRTGRLEDVGEDGARRKFDVAAAFRCISAHRDTVLREKARRSLSDEVTTMAAINAKIDALRARQEQAIALAAKRAGIVVPAAVDAPSADDA